MEIKKTDTSAKPPFSTVSGPGAPGVPLPSVGPKPTLPNPPGPTAPMPKDLAAFTPQPQSPQQQMSQEHISHMGQPSGSPAPLQDISAMQQQRAQGMVVPHVPTQDEWNAAGYTPDAYPFNKGQSHIAVGTQQREVPPLIPGEKAPEMYGDSKAVMPPTRPLDLGQMRTASCRCKIDVGHCVPLTNVTPAEALLLSAEFQKNAKGKPLYDVVEGASVTRTVGEEVARLTNKYGPFKVKALFSGAIPTLPSTFDEAIDVGMKSVSPQNKLGSFVIGH